MHRQEVTRGGGIRFKLLPKTQDMIVNCPGRRVVFISPDLIKKFFSRHHSVRQSRKKLQQLKFLGRECEPLARARCFHTGKVNFYVVEHQELMWDCVLGCVCDIRNRWVIRPTPPHRSTHASEKLLRAKRLRDIVIRAEFEQKHFVFDLRIRTEHHHRYRSSISLEGTAEFLAGQAWKLQVKYHDTGNLPSKAL